MVARLTLVVILLAGCRRPAAPPEPDAAVDERIEVVPPAEIEDRVNETLQKEHERTLDPKVE
jgi:hypothetical protein